MCILLATAACTPDSDTDAVRSGGSPDADAGAGRLVALDRTIEVATSLADSIEELLRPVPLLTPGEEASLRRSSNARQLARARALGVQVRDSTQLQQLIGAGRLLVLEDSTDLWIVRDLGYSLPVVTPAARALLEQIGTRFQERLGTMGLPPYRLEITSALRTPQTQAALRESNVNAAVGTSTHEFGTTLDIAYEGYAAPARLSLELPDDPQLAAFAQRSARLALERVAARKSRELKKVLGLLLRDMENEGLLMVTLERQQPVFHLTVARELPATPN